MENKLVCVTLHGQTPAKEEAETIAETFKGCPYVYFIGTEKNHLLAVVFLTEARARIWYENQSKDPRKIFGLHKASVILAEKVHHPKQLKLRLPRTMRKQTPCGLKCPECPAYGECPGCPATVFYTRSSP